MLCGCVAGAAPVGEIETWLANAGFSDIRITIAPEKRDLIQSWAPARGIENCIASAIIEARKPEV
jgi:arsenite methyltransferase